MDVLTYSEARADLKMVMDRVVDDSVPIVVARRRGRSVVMVSLEDRNAGREAIRERLAAAAPDRS